LTNDEGEVVWQASTAWKRASRVTATRRESEAPKTPSQRKSRRKAHGQGLLVLAVMIAALAGALAFAVFVRVG
jgi:ferric-dicitrate binding protein FerR (iron transport regulator)